MPSINSQYGDGGVTTSVSGGGFGGSDGSLIDLFRRLAEKRLAAESTLKPQAAAPSFRIARQQAPVTERRFNDSAGNAPPRGPSWQSLQGAATRPTGLGAQMIPGMAVDQNMLPPSMRHQSSQFQGLPGPSMAGLSPSEPEPEELPNSGYAFMSPIERARWAAAAARTAR